MMRDHVLSCVAARCPHLSAAELDAIYEDRVTLMARPPYAAAPLPPQATRDRMVELSAAWCRREALLRRRRAQGDALEYAAACAMDRADAKLGGPPPATAAAHSGATARPEASSQAAGGGGRRQAPLSAASALIRSAVATAIAAEQDAAKAEGRARDGEFFGRAAALVASGEAASLCLEQCNPSRTRATELASALVSNLASLRLGRRGGGGGGLTSSAALLLLDADEEVEGAAEAAAGPVVPPAQQAPPPPPVRRRRPPRPAPPPPQAWGPWPPPPPRRGCKAASTAAARTAAAASRARPSRLSPARHTLRSYSTS